MKGTEGSNAFFVKMVAAVSGIQGCQDAHKIHKKDFLYVGPKGHGFFVEKQV